MSKKLYEITFTAYAVAEDEQGAMDALVDAAVISSDSGMTIEMREAVTIAANWWDSLPFGGDEEITCGTLVGQIKNQGHLIE